MTTMQPILPSYNTPYRENQFSKQYEIEKYGDGYEQTGTVKRLGNEYKVTHMGGEDEVCRTVIENTDRLGLKHKKSWINKENKHIIIDRFNEKMFIVDKTTGMERQLTTEEIEKLVKLGLKVDNDDNFYKVAKIICKDNEYLAIRNESIHMDNAFKSGKWCIKQYKLGDFLFRRGKSLSDLIINRPPNQMNIIDLKVKKLLADYAQKLLNSLK